MKRAVLLIAGLMAVLPATAAAVLRTPAGWVVAPAGREIILNPTEPGFRTPLGTAISADGRYALSASSGATRFQTADLFDLGAGARTSLVSYDGQLGESVFYGVVFSPDGTRAWASGGGENVVHAYSVAGGQLTQTQDIPAPWFPAGLAYGHTPLGDRIYVANNLAGPAGADNPPGGTVTVIDPATNAVTGLIDLGIRREPLAIAFERRGRKAYVTNWMGRSVSVIDTARQQKLRDIILSPLSDPLQADHPDAIAANPARDQIYVANANSDTVSVIDTRHDRLAHTVRVTLGKGRTTGATPTGLAVTPNGRRLYVSLAGENAVEVIDTRTRRRLGAIPTAWYPTDVDVTPDGRSLVVTNTNGVGAGPNPCGPKSPLPQCNQDSLDPNFKQDTESVRSLIRGSLSVIPAAMSRAQLRAYTARVMRNNRVHRRPARKPPFLNRIRHVIYVVKENRTYDQVLGDLDKGNGDPRLTLFHEDAAPNHHELARRFTLFDNFYADAEVSADGHNWATHAGVTDYVERTWPIDYSPGMRGNQRAYDFEWVDTPRLFASEPLQTDPSIARSAAAPTRGFLWDMAYNKGVRYRVYGEFASGPDTCTSGGNASDITHLDPRFGNHVDSLFPAFNLTCSDSGVREPEWQREFVRFDGAHRRSLERYKRQRAQRLKQIARRKKLKRRHPHKRLKPLPRLKPPADPMPALEILRFPNDHTAGTRAGRATPESYMADNDLALGKMVDVVSHSSYWGSTAILVCEDDAQDGPDHVDAHRSIAYVISPYTQHATIDSRQYDTAAMVATIERLLGVPPMGIVDQRAPAMWPAFSRKPNFAPYTAIQPQITPFGTPGARLNATKAPMAAAASRWDLNDADAAPDVALNQSIWKAVRGRGARMPAPRHDSIIGSGAVPGDGG